MDLTGTYSFSGFTTFAGNTELVERFIGDNKCSCEQQSNCFSFTCRSIDALFRYFNLDSISRECLFLVEWSKYFIDNSFRYGPLFSHSRITPEDVLRRVLLFKYIQVHHSRLEHYSRKAWVQLVQLFPYPIMN